MNLPLKLPPRAGFPESYRYDAPITELGAMTAQMIGRGFMANKLPATTIVSSPALRCVQTASNMVKALDNQARVGVDALLFDFPGWYDQVPVWMDDAELNSIGIPVDGNYASVEPRDAIHGHKSESYVDYQKRVAANIQTLLQRYKEKQNVVMVTHGTTMDAIARGRPRSAGTATGANERRANERPLLHVPVLLCGRVRGIGGRKVEGDRRRHAVHHLPGLQQLPDHPIRHLNRMIL